MNKKTQEQVEHTKAFDKKYGFVTQWWISIWDKEFWKNFREELKWEN